MCYGCLRYGNIGALESIFVLGRENHIATYTNSRSRRPLLRRQYQNFCLLIWRAITVLRKVHETALDTGDLQKRLLALFEMRNIGPRIQGRTGVARGHLYRKNTGTAGDPNFFFSRFPLPFSLLAAPWCVCSRCFVCDRCASRGGLTLFVGSDPQRVGVYAHLACSQHQRRWSPEGHVCLDLY